jgi:hypothetical protein
MNHDVSNVRAVIYSRDNGKSMKWGVINRGRDTGAQFNTYLQASDYARDGALPIVALTVQACS